VSHSKKSGEDRHAVLKRPTDKKIKKEGKVWFGWIQGNWLVFVGFIGWGFGLCVGGMLQNPKKRRKGK